MMTTFHFRSATVVAGGLAALVTGCSFDPPVDERPFALTPAVDLNADPAIVEVELVARAARVEIIEGKPAAVWTYNDAMPGPLVEANLGDRVIIHARNELEEPTTIHWHGLRVPAAMDGVPAMQDPIEPGETFTYDFIVNDALLAWYHPHIRSAEQVERGLQAAFVVRDPAAPVFGRETILILDDVSLDADGGLNTTAGGHMAAMDGRLGDTILVNGHRRPLLTVASGEPQLFRVVNTANARTMALRVPGHSLTWIGTDGGLLETPRVVDQIIVSPGERADFLLRIDGDAGDGLDLEVAPVAAHASGSGMIDDNAVHKAMRLRIGGEASSFAPLPDTLAVIPSLATTGERTIVMTGGMTMNMHGGMGMDGFGFNGEQWPDVTPIRAAVGDVETWLLDNRTDMAHPFHLHGNRFQVVASSSSSDDELPRGWKDNVLVPANETVTLAVSLDGGAGRWMYHCHILEHAEGGMMGEVELRER